MSITLSVPPAVVQEVRPYAERNNTSLAEKGLCEVLYSGVNDGQVYCGVKAVNPFK